MYPPLSLFFNYYSLYPERCQREALLAVDRVPAEQLPPEGEAALYGDVWIEAAVPA